MSDDARKRICLAQDPHLTEAQRLMRDAAHIYESGAEHMHMLYDEMPDVREHVPCDDPRHGRATRRHTRASARMALPALFDLPSLRISGADVHIDEAKLTWPMDFHLFVVAMCAFAEEINAGTTTVDPYAGPVLLSKMHRHTNVHCYPRLWAFFCAGTALLTTLANGKPIHNEACERYHRRAERIRNADDVNQLAAAHLLALVFELQRTKLSA